MVDRILVLISEKGLSVNAVEKQLGFGNGAIKRFSKSSPSIDKIIALSNFLNVSVEYILFGKEKSSPTVELTADERELLDIYNKLSDKSKGMIIGRAELLAELEVVANDQVDETEIETLFIEYSTLKVSAGTGEPLIDDTYPEFIEVKRNEITEEANFAVKINGDSMLPYYKNNDIVLVRSQPTIEIGEIGIFIVDGSGYIKERADDRLISLNPEYDDIFFKEGQDVRCKGLVIGTL